MPFEFNGKIAVTKDELTPRFFPSWDALEKKLYRDAKKPVGMRRLREGKGLNCEVLIDFDTLPLPIRQQLPDPRKVNCILEKFFHIDGGAVRYYSEKKIGKLGYIDPERQKEYVLDASVLGAVIRLRAAHVHERLSRNGKVKNVDKYLSKEVNLFNEFRKIRNFPQHTLPTHHLRLRDKLKRFEETGYDSLLKGYDNQNALLKTERIEGLLNAMYIQKQKPSKIEVFRMYDAFLQGEVEVINPETGELYNPADYSKLSKRTVTTFLSSWKERVATHLKRAADRQQYMAKYEPFASLERPEYAGCVVSVDDRQPPLVYDKQNHRAWLYIGIDLGSECCTGFVWGKEKNAALVLEFYREMTRYAAEWGLPIPAQLECESSLNSTLKNTLLQEGNMFEYVNILSNRAHSKRIERIFLEMRNRIEKKWPGWIGRPFARDEANQTSGDSRTIIPYDLLIQQCVKEIIDWNNMPHSQHPEKTRWEIHNERQHPEVKPINWRGILPYLGERTETSCNRGNIKLNGEYFLLGDEGQIYTGDSLLNLMEMVEGKAIDVFWLRGHKGQVLKALVYVDGRCVCEALPKPKAYRSRLEARSDPQAAAKMELTERYANTVRGWAQRHKNEIEKLVIADNRKATLNDGFKIDWLEGANAPLYNDDHEVEVLDTPDEFNACLNPAQTTYKRRGLSLETF